MHDYAISNAATNSTNTFLNRPIYLFLFNFVFPVLFVYNRNRAVHKVVVLFRHLANVSPHTYY